MGHAVAGTPLCVEPGRLGPLCEAPCVVEQDIGVADMDADGWQGREVHGEAGQPEVIGALRPEIERGRVG